MLRNTMMSSRCILIVDDEYIILESLRIQLERNLPDDVIIESASSFEEAEVIMHEIASTGDAISAVISDYNLGDVKGSEVLRVASMLFPRVKKSILSGHAHAQDVVGQNPDIRLDAFFSKPWKTEDLVGFVLSSFD